MTQHRERRDLPDLRQQREPDPRRDTPLIGDISTLRTTLLTPPFMLETWRDDVSAQHTMRLTHPTLTPPLEEAQLAHPMLPMPTMPMPAPVIPPVASLVASLVTPPAATTSCAGGTETKEEIEAVEEHEREATRLWQLADALGESIRGDKATYRRGHPRRAATLTASVGRETPRFAYIELQVLVGDAIPAIPHAKAHNARRAATAL